MVKLSLPTLLLLYRIPLLHLPFYPKPNIVKSTECYGVLKFVLYYLGF